MANPTRRGSRSPTRQFLISTPFFCLGFISVGLASSNRSFKAPSNTAKGSHVGKVVKHPRLHEKRCNKREQIELDSPKHGSMSMQFGGRLKYPPALGILIESTVLTLPSHPSILTAVAVEKRSAGPSHRIDL